MTSSSSLMTDQEFLRWIYGSRRHDLNKSRNEISRLEVAPLFIPPFFKRIKDGFKSNIVIVSAPGAVGKTTLAKHCSYSKQAYLWDLSKIKLGDNSFIGTIAECFGPKKLSKILEDFGKGEITFLFDAFDEAEIISRWEGVEKFVREVYSYGSNSSRMNMILFSRSETSSLLELLLSDLGGPDSYSMIEIDYFDKIGARSFIKANLKSNGDNSFENFREPFENALNLIFETIAKGLKNGTTGDIWENLDIRSFIGYSPVLQAISSYLEGQNYEEVAQKFSGQESGINGLSVVKKFIEDLLTREQEKVLNALKQKVIDTPDDWNEWERIYSPEYQIQFVLSYICGEKNYDHILQDPNVPDWLMKEFKESVRPFLPNHPFIRDREYNSPSFRDYTLGLLLHKGDQRKKIVRYIESGSFALTPLFSYFHKDAKGGHCIGPNVGYIYESAVSRSGYEDTALLTFIKPSRDNLFSLEIINQESIETFHVNFECLIDKENPLVFERRLNHATINVDGEIILGSRNGSIELSNVDIKAKTMRVGAREFFVNCFHGRDTVLFAESFIQDDYSLSFRRHGDGQFMLFWNGVVSHPWSDYFVKIDPNGDRELEEEFYALKRILTPFRKHGKGAFGKNRDFVENVIVSGNDLRRKIFNHLLENKLIIENQQNNQYLISEDAFGAMGINWSDVKQLNISKNLHSFLLQFRD